MNHLRIVDLPPMDIPKLACMPAEVRRYFAHIDSIYHSLPGDISELMLLIKRKKNILRKSWILHELSPYYIAASQPRRYRMTTTIRERKICIGVDDEIGSLESLTAKRFRSLFRGMVADLKAGSLRRGSIYTCKDLKGYRVRFPPPSHLKRLLYPLRLLTLESAESPSFSAIVSYVVISGMHPLTDGNGRLSRIAFNTIMRYHFPNTSYLPIYEISSLSQGSHVLCCREAQYHNDWSHIALFFKTIISDLVEAADKNRASPKPFSVG